MSPPLMSMGHKRMHTQGRVLDPGLLLSHMSGYHAVQPRSRRLSIYDS